MIRAVAGVNLLASAVLLFCFTGCDKGGNDASLPPAERANRFDQFAKVGMDWTELAAKFKPAKYNFGLSEPGDPTKHRGGTPWVDYKSDNDFRQALKDTKDVDGFELKYIWSQKPDVWTEAVFSKDGKLESFDRTGDFNR